MNDIQFVFEFTVFIVLIVITGLSFFLLSPLLPNLGLAIIVIAAIVEVLLHREGELD